MKIGKLTEPKVGQHSRSCGLKAGDTNEVFNENGSANDVAQRSADEGKPCRGSDATVL